MKDAWVRVRWRAEQETMKVAEKLSVKRWAPEFNEERLEGGERGGSEKTTADSL